MSDTSPILSLPFIQPSQAQKHVTHNEALARLDALVQLAVNDRDRSTPPAAPDAGQRHIVATPASGVWSGHEAEIAVFDNGAWWFAGPMPGWRAEVLAEGRAVVFDGTDWVEPGMDGLPGVGVNTSADPINRLAVSSPATLFSHEGAGHQIKVNKSGVGDTASVLFQTGWSGRAEVGLTGQDNLSVKVSPDGGAWTDALMIDSATGHASGEAVQAAADDTTPGRLMRADYGYGPGNLLGTVSQSAGLPNGAVFERGGDANGEYVRFADGTQICTHELDLDWNQYNNVTANWTFPVPFAIAPNVSMAASNSGSDYVNCSASQFGLFRQGQGTTSVALTLTGLETLDSAARVRDIRVTAVGRWF